MPDNLRSRFVAAAPPAPVPEQRAAPPAPETDRSRLRAPEPAISEVASDADVVRAGGSMAIATLISRITGFLRNLLIAVTLGGAVGSAFNTANTLPNLITEIVLGAVLTSLVVPVLVRAEKEDADRGTAFFRRLFTLSASLLLVVTALSLVGAPFLTRLMLDADGEVNVIQSTSFAYLLLPQIFFYGIFALFMAVLNTRGIFKPGAWAPVANNVVSITVLLLYMLLPGELGETAPSGVMDPHVMLLGLGTTLGVIVQAAIMVPYLRRAGVDLRPLWGIDDRLKQFGGMAVAIVAYVAVSQLGYVITTRIASLADAAAPLIYQQHWLLLQVPYGIIGVTLLTAIMPRLSRNAADGDDRAVVADLNLATKLTFIALIPIVVFFTAFGPDIGVALFAYRNFDTESGILLGLTLSFSAFTLLPYALVLLHLRVFYAREEAWTPTYIIIGITATKIVLSLLAPTVASSPSRVVILLGAANGFGFIAGAVIGALLLRRKLGHLGTRSQIRTSTWAFAASLIGVAVALLIDWILPSFGGLGSFGVLIRVAVSGVVFLVATGIALSFSGLPEVQNLGRAFARIPGMSRFVRPDTSRAIEVGESNPQEVSAHLTALDPFAASLPPAPMSAGVVRGPRLVPGAPVSDGRFRLLADHGSVPGARFWHAKELASGREVALTFVDTSGNAPLAPATPAAAAGAAAEVARRTRRLTDVPGVAGNLEVLGYRNGCLIVADWVPGSPLRTVADGGDLDPQAVAAALVPLVDAAGRDLPLGLDNHARIRISVDGVATLAFPAVLPDATAERDHTSITSMLSLLGVEREDLPATQAEVDEPLVVEEEELGPLPDARPGFGDKSYSAGSVALIGALSIGAVVLVAALTTYLVSVVGGDGGEAPVSSESIQGSATETTPRPLPRVLEATASAPEIADGDTGTVWSGEGGVTLLLDDAVELQNVLLRSGGGPVEVYGLRAGQEAATPEGLPLLGSADMRDGRTTMTLDRPMTAGGVLLWFPEAVEVAEVQVVGVR
ncbi:murein biosynthesis integral membrane protein MurJ [Corynebacterium sp.]|uniref:murein biosynthesis integral membrane protein MurJ n=1 Tax=Corynebacterium sp. TaxID=1720 RepID=UPI0026E00629|nr:murein biosynthesis integral membrane protein MurJ [Corynebacterium sp.]MDO5511517.1 murein biosynthesis integral membrane protein MurJ [Corynebacterium sp.]